MRYAVAHIDQELELAVYSGAAAGREATTVMDQAAGYDTAPLGITNVITSQEPQ